MLRTACLASVCCLLLLSQVRAQEVMIAREAKSKYPKAEAVSPADASPEKAVAAQSPAPTPALPAAAQPTVAVSNVATGPQSAAAVPLRTSAPKRVIVQRRNVDPVPLQTTAVPPRYAHAEEAPSPKKIQKKKPAVVASEPRVEPKNDAAPAPAEGPSTSPNDSHSIKIAASDVKPEAAPAKPAASPATKPKASVPSSNSTQLSPLTKPAKPQIAAKLPPAAPKKTDAMVASAPLKSESGSSSHLSDRRISLAAAPQPVSFSGDSAFVRLADGFDFPVGRPEAQGYYKARGFRSHGHLGEDWDGVGGGDTDLGDPIYCIGDGVVVFARDCHMGWGNVVIVRHSYREGGSVRTIDSLYGHLQTILVHRGQSIARGQKIATMGTAHGLYDAHLHLEIRKNLEIGMSRAAFARDFSNYYDPSQFIASHRHLQTGGTYRVAMNTFTHDGRINWDKARNFSHARTGGGSSESAAALKRTLAQKK